MDTVKIAPGTYALTANVVNPKPDRRSKNSDARTWRNHTEWRKGAIFVATEDQEFHRMRVYYRGGYSMDALHEFDPGFAALVPHLAPIDEAPSDYLLRLHSSGGMAGGFALQILDKLEVNRATIDHLLAEIEEEEFAKEEGR